MTTKVTSHIIAPQAVDTPSLKDASVTNDKLAATSVTTDKVANVAITNPLLGSASVDNRVLASAAVHDTHINDVSTTKLTGTITNSQIDTVAATKITGTILGPQIGLQQIASGHFYPGAVNTLAIQDSALVTSKYADNSVTYGKIQSGTANSILVNNGSGAVSVLAAGAENAILSIVSGSPAWTTSIIPTGAIMDYFGNGAPQGWVLCNGGTLGSAASAGTALASLQAQTLFYFLWSNFSDSICPVAGGRGGSAASDWTANKVITLPDFRGRVGVGADSASAPSNRISTVTGPFGGSAINSTVGGVGGAETVTMDVTQMPNHKHLVFGINTVGGVNSNTPTSTNNAIVRNAVGTDQLQYSSSFSEPTTIQSGTAGGSSGVTQPLTRMQPFVLVTKIMKL